jgi:hypothetical protein
MENHLTLLVVDWATGKELGKTILGNSPIYNTMGGLSKAQFSQRSGLVTPAHYPGLLFLSFWVCHGS